MNTILMTIDGINHNGVWAQIAASIGILFLFIITRKIIAKLIIQGIIKISRIMKASSTFEKVMLTFERTVRMLYVFTALYTVFTLFKMYGYYHDIIITFLRVLLIIIVSIGVYNFLNTTPAFIKKISHKTGVGLDDAIASFITNILKFSIFLLDTVLILSEFGYDISGFIAGLGIGGLAFALAAKDTAANIFGGIVIFLDKTFSIGDWIQTPRVEGIVEDVTLRSTRIRTFSDSIAIVPNSVLTQEIITNCERMNKRRVKLSIIIPYTTPGESIRACLEKIRKVINTHPGVNRELRIAVLDKFNETGMEILIIYYTNTLDYKVYLNIKEEINFKVIEIFETENVSFALSPGMFYQNPGDNEK